MSNLPHCKFIWYFLWMPQNDSIKRTTAEILYMSSAEMLGRTGLSHFSGPSSFPRISGLAPVMNVAAVSFRVCFEECRFPSVSSSCTALWKVYILVSLQRTGWEEQRQYGGRQEVSKQTHRSIRSEQKSTEHNDARADPASWGQRSHRLSRTK